MKKYSQQQSGINISARTKMKYLGPQWLHHFDSVLVEMNRAVISLPSFFNIPAFGSPFDEKILSTTIGHQYFGPYRDEIPQAAMASSFRLCLGRNESGCNQLTFILQYSCFWFTFW